MGFKLQHAELLEINIFKNFKNLFQNADNLCMQRLQVFTYWLIHFTADIFLFSFAFLLGCLTRYFLQLDAPAFSAKFDLDSLISLGLFFYLTNLFFLSYFKVYKSKQWLPFEKIIHCYFQATVASLIAQVIIAFLYPFYPTSRLLLVSSSSYAFLLLIVKEAYIRKFFVFLWKQGYNVKKAIVVSNNENKIMELASQAEKDYFLCLKMAGVISRSPSKENRIAGLPVVGSIDNFEEALEGRVVDTVIFLDHNEGSSVSEALWVCEERGIEVWLKLDILDRPISKTSVEYLRDIPFLHFETGPQNGAALFFKNVLDKVLAIFFLTLFAPFFIILPILVKLSSPGPVFFVQQRAGLGGRKFGIYKFRTMHDGADQQRFANLKEQNEMSGPVFKLQDDPRITRLGKFMRKYSLDEFPQFWNVFKGDMSIVGPRPLRVEEADMVCGWQKRRLQMKPGITCIWQVSGRSDIKDFESWVKLDLQYIDNWSIWLDLKLLFKTVPAVLTGAGSR